MLATEKIIATCLLTYMLLFSIGVFGLVFSRRSLLRTLMSLELLLLACNLNFILFSIYLDDFAGYVFVIFILILSAVESALGLVVLSSFYNKKGHVRFDLIKLKAWEVKY